MRRALRLPIKGTRCASSLARVGCRAASTSAAAAAQGGETIPQFLKRHTDADQYKDALVWGPVPEKSRWTWEQVSGYVNALGTGMQDLRLLPGANLPFLMGNDLESVITPLATASASVALSFVPQEATPEQILKLLRTIRARSMMMTEKTGDRDNVKMFHDAFRYLHCWPVGVPLKVRGYDNLKHLIHTGQDKKPGFLNYRDSFVPRPLEDYLGQVGETQTPDDVAMANVLFQSNGDPTVLAFSHRGVLAGAHAAAEAAGFSSTDRVTLGVSAGALSGQVSGSLAVLAARGFLVLPGSEWDAESTLATAASEESTAVTVSPEQLISLAEAAAASSNTPSTLASAFVVSSPGSSVTDAQLEAAAKAIGVQHVNRITSIPHVAGPLLVDVRDGSGDVATGVKVRFVDDSGKQVSDGTSGVLQVSGTAAPCAQIATGGDAKPVAGGWVTTGVRGKVASGGRVSV